MALSKFVFFETPFEQYEVRLTPYTQNEKMFEFQKVWVPEGGKEVIKSGQRLCLPPSAWAGLKSSIAKIDSLEQQEPACSSALATSPRTSASSSRDDQGDEMNEKARYHGGRKMGSRNKWTYLTNDTDLGALTEAKSQFKLCYRVPTKMLIEKDKMVSAEDPSIEDASSVEKGHVQQCKAARNLARKRTHKATELKRNKDRRNKQADVQLTVDENAQAGWPKTDIKMEPMSG